MIRNELKSILRDKKNLIYIVVFIIISITLNISLNIQNKIDSYYDNIINEYIKIANENLSNSDLDESLKDRIDYQELIKTVQTMDGKLLNDEQKNELKNMKHVQYIKSKEHHSQIAGTLTIYSIIVDDWKNCESVQKYLDNQGIASYVDTIGIDENIFKNYKTIKNFVNIIKYIIVIIIILILNICFKNIIKNEEKNYKLLKIFGYRRYSINFIKISQLLTLLSIGFVSGYIIYKFISLLANI